MKKLLKESEMKRVLFVSAVLALVCCGGALNAATATHTAFMPSSYTDAYATLSVPQFNPALGTLNSVKFDVSSLFTATLTASTSAANQYIVLAVEDPTISLIAPDSSTLISSTLGWIVFVGTPPATPATGAERIPIVPNVVYSDTKSLSGSGTQTIMSGLLAYIGAGTVSLPFSATVPGFALGTQGGNNVTTLRTVASADLLVTYDYTPIPEPASIIVLVGGLGSLLAVRRRKV